MSLIYTLTTNSGLYLKKINKNSYALTSSKKDMLITKDRFLLEEIRSNLKDYIEKNIILSNKLNPEKIYINVCNNDGSLTKVQHHYHSYGYFSKNDIYYTDYENEPIGGDNPYYCCKDCGISEPQINMALNGHSKSCEYRINKEKEIIEKEILEHSNKKMDINIYNTNSDLGYI